MRKALIPLAVIGTLMSCGQDGSKPSEDKPKTEVKDEKDPVTVEYLQDRFYKGMDYDAYSVEIKTWVDKGQADIQETVKPAGNGNVSADIIQVADGFLAVVNDSKEITEIKTFPTPEEAKSYLEKNM
ncbi:hypothetical protein [Bacillus sp. REN3]|uniref:hypothetical protein n=1 Tax=Bacillus sp. REN3 TaxID=2802440 RepID=UPI001AEDA726|nr:hypothetical protein [Bacillus sp. REN3]